MIRSMRTVVLIIAVTILIYDLAGDRSSNGNAQSNQSDARISLSSGASASAPTRVDFDAQVKPILQSKCMPCHFSGGQMYERLPFDRPDTIRKLGEKLFTRIKDEEHRRVIRDFLAQKPKQSQSPRFSAEQLVLIPIRSRKLTNERQKWQ